MGMRTNLMKPICADGFVTFSRSMKGATGRPSSFSRSDCASQQQTWRHTTNIERFWSFQRTLFMNVYDERNVQLQWLHNNNYYIHCKRSTLVLTTKRESDVIACYDGQSHTWLKYSSSRQSTHGSDTSNGRTSFEMSQHLINTIFNCKTYATSLIASHWPTVATAVLSLFARHVAVVGSYSSIIANIMSKKKLVCLTTSDINMTCEA